MAVHPIDFRYGTDEMRNIWNEDAKIRQQLRVEAALAKAEAGAGLIPAKAADTIAAGADKVTLPRVKEIESEIQHDIMAVVLALSEQCGEAGRWVHFGATSNDIIDTGTALQIKDTIAVLRKQLISLLDVLLTQAGSHKNTVCAARTHGQIAIPTTYGMRFALWASEVARHIERLDQLSPRILVGKMSGAVGTHAAFGQKGLEIDISVMKLLGLGTIDISNQIIQRDRHAEFVMWMANIVTTLDKICIEIRSLQRTEIGELEESFGKKQVGSSTMPHKRNPIKSEQVCGLARIVRAMVEPELMNNTLWDERDLTNSSGERVVFPEACVLTDHLIRLTARIIRELRFNPDNIRRNLELPMGLNMAEPVMMELAKRGVGRQEAHAIVRECAMTAFEGRRHMKDVLLENSAVSKYMKREEIEDIMEPGNYTGTAVEQVEALITKLCGRFIRAARD